MSALLQVEDLAVDFRRPGWRRSSVHAVDGVSFTINERETVGFAGESGSGKSTIGRCVLGLIRPTRGRIVFDGVDITRLSSSRRRRLSTEIQVVFQDPNSSLNPARSIEQSLREPMEVARGLSRSAARDAPPPTRMICRSFARPYALPPQSERPGRRSLDVLAGTADR